MRGLVGLLSGASLLFCLAGGAAAEERPTGDSPAAITDAAAQAGSPDAAETLPDGVLVASGDAGGFEPPPDDPTPPPVDDSQYDALKEVLQKMKTPLERVTTMIWFLIIQPKSPHREEIARMVDQQAGTLTAPQQAEFREYMGVRKSLSGGSYGTRIDRWKQYLKGTPSGSFSDLAKREVQHLQGLRKDKANERHAGRGRFLAKLGIVAIVLALVAVIIFGAAK